ncbi:MAG: hypothetical protein EPN33_01510 [Acidobacteria bacterium]|nr:MAG: hypothetical protein EPN33_01510 [Acidobacteriota bacterium]
MAAVLAGCAPSGLHYTLTANAYGPNALQPPRAAAHAKPRRLHLRLQGGAACRALHGGYDGGALFGFAWRLRNRDVGVMVDSRLSHFHGNLPVPLLHGIQSLHNTLESAVGAGCLSPEASQTLLRRTAADVALDPGLAQRIVFGAYGTQQYIDIAGAVELDLTYALHQNQPRRYDRGYVARRYRFRSHDGLGRGWLQLRSTRVQNAPVPHHIPPAPIPLPLAGPPVYLRLFFYLRIAPNAHDVALVAARTHAALAQATTILHHNPRSCASMRVPGIRCLVTPADDTLEAGIAVTVQGVAVAAPLPGSVRQALNAAGLYDTNTLARTLRVLRPYQGHLIPVHAPNPDALLDLVLSGGERISW